MLRDRGMIYKLHDERKGNFLLIQGNPFDWNGDSSAGISDFLTLGTWACLKVFIFCVSAYVL